MLDDLDRAAFEHTLRRWYEVDEPDALDTATLERLWKAWRAFAADQARVDGQERLFASENTRVVHGHAWWEERQRGQVKTALPITTHDRLNMWLSTDARLGPRPRPRPHCPDELVGTWRLAGVSLEREEPRPPAAEQTWTLRADGTMSSTGHPERGGTRWRVHLSPTPELLLVGPDGHPEKLVVIRRPGEAGDSMDVRGAGQLRGFTRWARVG